MSQRGLASLREFFLSSSEGGQDHFLLTHLKAGMSGTDESITIRNEINCYQHQTASALTKKGSPYISQALNIIYQ
jgi:hypothetical protein